MTTEQLLENRHTVWLEWNEPWPATAPQGMDIYANVTMSATVHDCVNLQRRIARQLKPNMDVSGQDAEFLDSFMAVHWAVPSFREQA